MPAACSVHGRRGRGVCAAELDVLALISQAKQQSTGGRRYTVLRVGSSRTISAAKSPSGLLSKSKRRRSTLMYGAVHLVRLAAGITLAMSAARLAVPAGCVCISKRKAASSSVEQSGKSATARPVPLARRGKSQISNRKSQSLPRRVNPHARSPREGASSKHAVHHLSRGDNV